MMDRQINRQMVWLKILIHRTFLLVASVMDKKSITWANLKWMKLIGEKLWRYRKSCNFARDQNHSSKKHNQLEWCRCVGFLFWDECVLVSIYWKSNCPIKLRSEKQKWVSQKFCISKWEWTTEIEQLPPNTYSTSPTENEIFWLFTKIQNFQISTPREERTLW